MDTKQGYLIMLKRKKLTVWDTVKRQWSLIVGLRVTGINYVKPQLTVHYPRETVGADSLAGYKGHIQLVGKPKEPAVPKCICCMLCVTSCPSGCIKVVKTKPPKVEESAVEGEPPAKPKAPKTPSRWTLDYNLCSLCGTCAEVCPVKSIEFSKDVYLAGTSRKDFEFDLMADLRERAAKAPAPEKKAKPEKKAEKVEEPATETAEA
ncbi:4Fe-4S dicluster domain-containing protein [Desulfocurvus sp. DL9XJH121]